MSFTRLLPNYCIRTAQLKELRWWVYMPGECIVCALPEKKSDIFNLKHIFKFLIFFPATRESNFQFLNFPGCYFVG